MPEANELFLDGNLGRFFANKIYQLDRLRGFIGEHGDGVLHLEIGPDGKTDHASSKHSRNDKDRAAGEGGKLFAILRSGLSIGLSIGLGTGLSTGEGVFSWRAFGLSRFRHAGELAFFSEN